MVLTDQQTPVKQLNRQMPVSQMIGQPRQARGPRPNLQERFRRGYNPDDAAAIENQAIAVIQPRGLLQIQEKFAVSAILAKPDAAPVAIVPA